MTIQITRDIRFTGTAWELGRGLSGLPFVELVDFDHAARHARMRGENLVDEAHEVGNFALLCLELFDVDLVGKALSAEGNGDQAVLGSFAVARKRIADAVGCQFAGAAIGGSDEGNDASGGDEQVAEECRMACCVVGEFVADDDGEFVHPAALEHQVDQVGFQDDVFLRQHFHGKSIDRSVAVLDEDHRRAAQPQFAAVIGDDLVDRGKLAFVDLDTVAEDDGLEILARQPGDEHTDQDEGQQREDRHQESDEQEQPDDGADDQHECEIGFLLFVAEGIDVFHCLSFLGC